MVFRKWLLYLNCQLIIRSLGTLYCEGKKGVFFEGNKKRKEKKRFIYSDKSVYPTKNTTYHRTLAGGLNLKKNKKKKKEYKNTT